MSISYNSLSGRLNSQFHQNSRVWAQFANRPDFVYQSFQAPLQDQLKVFAYSKSYLKS